MLYKLSRFSKVHNFLRLLSYSILQPIPVPIKYGIGYLTRKTRMPYKILTKGDTVIQIGAPSDILRAGRSRAIYFSKLVGNTGLVIVFEADLNNVEQLNKFIKDYKIQNIKVIPIGAWNKPTNLRFLINDKHPASNLVQEVFDDDRTDIEDYRVVEIDVDSIDNVLSDMNVMNVELLSITSNGSEEEILQGANATQKIVKNISIIGDPKRYPKILDYGFRFKCEDDRGYLYTR
jgi:FkbM family methyltransferase